MAVSDEGLAGKVLVCATLPRDAQLTQEVLAAAGIACESRESGADLVSAVHAGPDAVVLSEEGLDESQIEKLAVVLEQQPPWSDIPFIILASGGSETESSGARLHYLERLGNITVLERPVRKLTVVAAVRAALRARRRQYEIRKYLNDLAQQAERLAQSNDDLQQFAYVTSHDLREPLRTVSAFTQLLAEKYAAGIDAQAQEWIGFITGAVKRMEALIRDLLAYSRLSGETQAMVPVHLDRVLERTRQDLRQALEESDAEITAEPMPVVMGDELELIRLFENIVSNAIKYRRPGIPPRLSICAIKRDMEWELSIADNGIGFEQKYADRIFDVFKRLHGKDIPGTGIGLAICRKIVERHGGRIWADSQPGHGSTFHFTIPARE